MYSVSGTSFHKRSNIFVNPCTHSLRRSINVEIAIRNVRKLRRNIYRSASKFMDREVERERIDKEIHRLEI